MIRLLHILAITILIGSAAYAYSIKYESLYYAEEVVKLKGKLAREREAIAVAKAEWSLMIRPDRLQRLTEQHLDLQVMSVNQLGKFADLPVRPPKGDAIGMKLEALIREPTATPKDKRPTAKSDGIGLKLEALLREPTATPKEKRPSEARTPTTTGSIGKAPR
jgi:hypothetical protein